MKNVISYSLWGDDPFYVEGALHNIALAKKFYPNWVCRFYIDETVPDEFYKKLVDAGAEVVERTGNRGTLGSMWRFEVMFDPEVDKYIIRDTDSRIYYREKVAVDEWLESGKSYHVMRDHRLHNVPMLAGMWGGTVSNSMQFQEAYFRWINDPNVTVRKGCDQAFLELVMWRTVRNDMVCHDRFKNYGGRTGEEREFPIPLEGEYFVGAPVDCTERHEEAYADYQSNS